MLRRLAVPLAALAVLVVAAGATLAALSAGDGAEDATEEQHRVRPFEDDWPVFMRRLPPGLERMRPFFDDSALDRVLPLPGVLPQFIREFDRLVEGAITYLDDDGNPQTVRVVAGTITEVSPGSLTVVYNGGGARQDVSLTDDTQVLVGLRPAALDDLELDQRVLVAARGNEAGWRALAVVVLPGWLAGDED